MGSTKAVLNLIDASNLVQLVSGCRCVAFVDTMVGNFLHPLPTKGQEHEGTKCNLDLAGKFPLARQLAQMGLQSRIFIDFCISGGILSRNGYTPDGISMDFQQKLADINHFVCFEDVQRYKGNNLIEIKGVTRSASNQYQVSIYTNTLQKWIVENTHFLLVMRTENPEEWLSADLGHFNLGHIRFKDLIQLLIEVGKLQAAGDTYKIVPPVSNGTRSNKKKSKKKNAKDGPKAVSFHVYNNLEDLSRKHVGSEAEKMTIGFKWVKLSDLTHGHLVKWGLLDSPIAHNTRKAKGMHYGNM